MNIGDNMKKKDLILTIVAVIMIVATYMVLCSYKNFIEIKDGKQNLPLVEGLISYVAENEKDIMKDAEYIAIDANSFNILSQNDTNKLINYLKNYNTNIIIGSFSILNDEEFMNEDNSLKGVFISASEFKIISNRVECEYSIYKSTLSSVGYKVKATFKANKWKIEYKEYHVS